MRKTIILNILWILTVALIIILSLETFTLVSSLIDDGTLTSAITIFLLALTIFVCVASSYFNGFLSLILLILKEATNNKVVLIVLEVLKILTYIPLVLLIIGLITTFDMKCIILSIAILIVTALSVYLEIYLIRSNRKIFREINN